MTTADQIHLAHQIPGVLCGDQHSATCVRVREAFIAVAQWEVNRAVNITHEARDFCGQQAQQARQKGDKGAHAHFVAMANTFHIAAMRIALPPGGCEQCLNTRQVPSALMPGQLVPCECTRQEAVG